MRPLIPLLALVVLAAGPGLAQEVTGRVVSSTDGSPLPLAEVHWVGQAARDTTDDEGRWRLPLPPGRHVLDVRRIGYASRRAPVDVGAAADSGITIALTPMALPLDAIVVTAARREQRLADAVVTTEVVSRREIEATGASNVAAVLQEQTGIQFQPGLLSGSGVVLQGLGSERVLVLLDGQPLYGRISGDIDLSRIPTQFVERIEVVKGPQSTLYGSEAMGGVINVITRDPPARSWRGNAYAVGGTANRLDAGLSAGLAQGSVAATADVGWRSIERTPGVSAELGALTRRLDGAAAVRWNAAPALELHAGAVVLQERQRWLSGGLYDFADNTQVSARAGARWRLGAHRLAPTLYLSQFNHLSRQSTFPSPIAGTGDRQVQRLAEAEVLYGGTLFGVTVDGGVEARQERISTTDGRIGRGVQELYSVEPFAQAEWTFGALSVVPGVRLTWNEQWGTALTPRIAVRYRAGSSVTLRASVGRGFRAPDFKELYLQFVNDAAGYAVYGNRDLRPEHSTNVAAGVEWSADRAYLRAQGYWNELRDFIETRLVPGSGSLALYTYGNVERGRTAGAEVEIGSVLGPIRAEAGYSYLSTRDGLTGFSLLGRPTHAGRLRLSGDLGDGPRWSATGLYTGATPLDRDADGRITTMRERFVRVDLRIAQDVPLGLEVAAGVDNLFDRRPFGWADAVGRQFYAAVSWTFNGTTR